MKKMLFFVAEGFRKVRVAWQDFTVTCNVRGDNSIAYSGQFIL